MHRKLFERENDQSCETKLKKIVCKWSVFILEKLI